jgi:hypothetical protein
MGRVIPTQPSSREWRVVIPLSLGILLLASLPYLAGYAAQTPGYRFGGLVFNPIDGNSYLAKMEIGRRGGWLFRLPYTAEPGDGAPVFLFYILLGHVAAWTGAPSILVYHAARLLAGLFLLLILYAFVARFLERPGARLTAWLLIAVGSGLGWAAAAFGGRTSDVWVAEAIVFLSLLANPHFPLAAGLMLMLYLWLAPGLAPTWLGWKRGIAILLAATALAHVQPFALIPVLAVLPLAHLAAWLFAPGADRSLAGGLGALRPALPALALFVLASLPWLLFDYWLTQAHPVLSAWSAQNVTLSPPIWDYLVTFAPALALAVPGALGAARRRNPRDLFLLTWLIAGTALLYAPLALQRRLVQGLSIPIGVLAAEGLFNTSALAGGLRRVAAIGLTFALALPTNLLVLAATYQGVQTHHPLLYQTSAEVDALKWIDANTPPNALVLASPEMGLFIPATTGRRVIYGHPFETVNATVEKQAVTEFYQSPDANARDFLAERGVDYVMHGPREAALGPGPDPGETGLTPAFEEGEVTLYRVTSP